MLDTYRWQRIPSNAERKAAAILAAKVKASPTPSKTAVNQSASTSSSSDAACTSDSDSALAPVRRRRARSVAELHPLGQLRYIRPALVEQSPAAGNHVSDESSEESSDAGSSSVAERISSFRDDTEAIDSDEVWDLSLK